MYRIEMITGVDGNERTDGRYPLRKGCIGNIFHLKNGDAMVFEYIKDNEGKDKFGSLRTSIVEDYDNFGVGMTVYTMNSVYYLRKLS